jgi:hypothetical protein
MSDERWNAASAPAIPHDWGFDYERSVATVEGSNVANHLLRELMTALGIPIVASPATPSEVWAMVIQAATGSRDRAELAEAENRELRARLDAALGLLCELTDDRIDPASLAAARAFLARSNEWITEP